jgi:hypothetical protein
MPDGTGMDMLKSALGDHGVAIQTISDVADYFGDGLWVGLEDYELTNNEMVMINVGDECSISLSGVVVDASNVEITINPGWNWIGFPMASETPIDVAMSAFDPEIGDFIQDFAGTSDYLGEWIGDIVTLVPGQGYLYYSMSENPKVLVFSSSSSKNK